MDQPEKKQSGIACIFWLVIPLGFLALLFFGRRDLFWAAGMDLSRPDYWIPLLAGGLGLLCLWFGLLRRERPKGIWLTAMILFVVSVLGILYSLLLPTAIVRYQFFRFETLYANLGFTTREEGLRVELIDELLDPGIGPRIARDTALLSKLAFEHGEQFRFHPRAAQIAYGGLAAAGIGFEEIVVQPRGKEFLSAVLHAETNPDAWFGLDDYPRPELNPDPANRIHAGLLTSRQARTVVMHERNLNRDDSLDYLAFFYLQFPICFDNGDRETLQIKWKARFPELAEYVEHGFQLIEEVRSATGEIRPGKPLPVFIDVSPEKYLTPPEWKRNEMGLTIERTLSGVASIVASNIELVPEEDAELRLSAEVGMSHTFDRIVPVYSGKTVRVPAGRRIIGRGISIQTYRKEYRNEVVGSRTQAVLEPSIILQIDGEEEPIVIGEELFYWYDIVVAAKKNSGAEEGGERVDWGRLYDLYGDRIWPIGLKEDMFRFDGPVPFERYY